MTQAKILLLALLSLAVGAAQAQAAMPRPVIKFVRAEKFYVGPIAWIRYELSVVNRNDFDQALFQPTSDLPSCYASTNAAWLGVYDLANPGLAIHALCPRNRNELGSIQVAIKKGAYQTGVVTIKIIERPSNHAVWSNYVRIYRLPPAVTGVGPGVRPPAGVN